jgi:hypothetical protein
LKKVTMGLSIRAYARHRGVSHVAVKQGHRHRADHALPDGTIDPDAADAQWAQNTIAAAPRAAPEKVSGTKARPRPTRYPAEAIPQRDAADASTPPMSAGGTSLLQARTVNEVLKAQTQQGASWPTSRANWWIGRRPSPMFSSWRASERDAWLNWPARVSAQMAATLGVDPHTMHIALEAAVREHLIELGELRPRVD